MTSPPPVILLHAFPLHSALFSATTVPQPWQLVTPDRCGFGATPLASVDGSVPEPSMDVLVDDVVRLVDDMGADRVILGGVSLGGYVSLAFASRYPERLAGLVLADTKSRLDDDAGLQRRFDAAERADAGDVPDGRAAVEPMLGSATPGQTWDQLAAVAQQASPASIAWAQRAMAARRDTTDALAALTVPVLIVVGEEDRLSPVTEAEWMAATAGQSTLVVIPGAGHLTPAEAPEQFNDALAQWLDQYGARPE